MNCWKCHKSIGLISGKVPFRGVCPHCGTDTHVCKNCRYFAPGKPNDCIVPGTEFIRDREALNYCEEFKPKTEPPPAASTDKARRLFGLEEDSKKKDFNSLFKDEKDL